jgi:hypothetical protein
MQLNPYSIEIAHDPGVVKRVVALDQLKRLLDAAESGMWLGFPGPYPKSVNHSTRRHPEVDPLDERELSIRLSHHDQTARSPR